MYISNINTSTLKFSSIENLTLSFKKPEMSLSSHQNTLLIYLLDGQAIFSNTLRTFTVEKGQLVLLNPHQLCSVMTKNYSQLIVLRASGYQFTSSKTLESNQSMFHFDKVEKIIMEYFKLALLESSGNAQGKLLLLKRITECIIIHILQNTDFSIKDTICDSHIHDVETVIQYIKQHFKDKITLETLASLSDINKFYLIRIFKQHTGMSPIDYIIHVRIEAAKKLLRDSNTPISSIADQVGFHSSSHFTKVFKSIQHLTPSQYRKERLL